MAEKDFFEELEEIKSTRVKKGKQKTNSKAKGNRGENEFVKILNERFKPLKFIRTPGSGALVGGVNYLKNAGLEESIIETLASDIIVPKDFKFALEHKSYKNDSVRINHFISSSKYPIKEWWLQCKGDAEKTGKQPMLVVKLDRMPRFAIIKEEILNEYNFDNYLLWRNEKELLMIVELEELLKFDDKFFIKQ